VLSKVKIVAAAVVALVVLIVVLQNTEAVETKLLFVSVTMPRAALLFGTMIVGFALGVLCSSWLARVKQKADK
jgi:putative membrane protein